MPNEHGDFIWYELMTTDADAAQELYGDLGGWTVERPDMGPDVDYRLCKADGPHVGGLMALTQEMTDGGARPMWAGYIGVDDVDASATAIRDKGGTVLMEPQDIPEVGRFAFVTDCCGAPFYIMRGFSDEASEAFAHDAPRNGHCAWNELYSADPDSAKAFYRDIFGWVKADGMDMGEMGEYEFLKNGAGREHFFGAMMKKPEQVPLSMWSYYFRVPDIDTALDYVSANGGQIMMGPQEIPGGEFVLQGLDPQGALFALIGKRNA